MNLSIKRVNLFKLLSVVLLSSIIGACSVNQALVSEQDQFMLWEKHQNNLKTITAFQANGSFAYFTERSRYYGRFFINQITPNTYQLKLTTPVGSSLFSLMLTPYLAELTDNKGHKYRDENIEKFVSHLTGMDIPLKTLSHWLIGFSDDYVNDNIDSSGHLAKTQLLQQDQIWNLVIGKYMTTKYANKNIDLPAIIELTKQQNRLRLTINNWKLN